MKNLIIIAICLATLPVFAQSPTTDQEERINKLRDNVEALRVAYMTRELSLTAEEAQKFWPVYNEFHDKVKDEVYKGEGPMSRGKVDFDSMSDEELAKMVEEGLERRQKELNLQKEYLAKFRAILPARKANMVFLLDAKFRHEIMKKYHERMKGERGERGERGMRGGSRGPRGGGGR